jgi:hypothetical protein
MKGKMRGAKHRKSLIQCGVGMTADARLEFASDGWPAGVAFARGLGVGGAPHGSAPPYCRCSALRTAVCGHATGPEPVAVFTTCFGSWSRCSGAGNKCL